MATKKNDEVKQEASKSADAGQAEMQRNANEAEAQGFIGSKTDPEPNESYTVSGQTGSTDKAPAGSSVNR